MARDLGVSPGRRLLLPEVASNYGRDVTIMKVLQEVDVATAPPVDFGPTCREVFALIGILLGEL